jgi:AbrB family transcriptional regulator (stage V sporulation protein T)
MSNFVINKRIDELGRIVIPKEIRKELKIREGDSLEITIDEKENIILKKHSVMKGINDFSKIVADIIYSDLKKNVIITDNSKIIAAAGPFKKFYLNKNISNNLITSLIRRENMYENYRKSFSIIDDEKIEITYALSTIVVNGDAVGIVMIYDMDGKISEIDYKIIKIISNFLSKYIDE